MRYIGGVFIGITLSLIGVGLWLHIVDLIVAGSAALLLTLFACLLAEMDNI